MKLHIGALILYRRLDPSKNRDCYEIRFCPNFNLYFFQRKMSKFCSSKRSLTESAIDESRSMDRKMNFDPRNPFGCELDDTNPFAEDDEVKIQSAPTKRTVVVLKYRPGLPGTYIFSGPGPKYLGTYFSRLLKFNTGGSSPGIIPWGCISGRQVQMKIF